MNAVHLLLASQISSYTQGSSVNNALKHPFLLLLFPGNLHEAFCVMKDSVNLSVLQKTGTSVQFVSVNQTKL